MNQVVHLHSPSYTLSFDGVHIQKEPSSITSETAAAAEEHVGPWIDMQLLADTVRSVRADNVFAHAPLATRYSSERVKEDEESVTESEVNTIRTHWRLAGPAIQLFTENSVSGRAHKLTPHESHRTDLIAADVKARLQLPWRQVGLVSFRSVGVILRVCTWKQDARVLGLFASGMTLGWSHLVRLLLRAARLTPLHSALNALVPFSDFGVYDVGDVEEHSASASANAKIILSMLHLCTTLGRTTAWQQVLQRLQGGAVNHVVLSGFSLGGALLQIIGIALRVAWPFFPALRGITVRVFSPPRVGNSAFTHLVSHDELDGKTENERWSYRGIVNGFRRSRWRHGHQEEGKGGEDEDNTSKEEEEEEDEIAMWDLDPAIFLPSMHTELRTVEPMYAVDASGLTPQTSAIPFLHLHQDLFDPETGAPHALARRLSSLSSLGDRYLHTIPFSMRRDMSLEHKEE